MTQPTNHLAVELRQILDQFDGSRLVYQRLRRLTEHVERVGAEPFPAELEAIRAGLEPEQEIRGWALDVASYVIGDVSGTVNGVADHLIDLAEPLVDWIRDGARPELEPELPCHCTQEPGRSNVWDGTRCPRHNPLVRETWSRP